MILRVLGDVLRCRDLRRVLLAFVCFNAASMAGLAIGSIAASAFVALAGGRGAFVCLAATLPVAALLVVRPVLAADSAVLPVVEMRGSGRRRPRRERRR
jgi:mannose/fructose/N-acetylgalactosamine-specific phosphotransferase system component IIC